MISEKLSDVPSSCGRNLYHIARKLGRNIRGRWAGPFCNEFAHPRWRAQFVQIPFTSARSLGSGSSRSEYKSKGEISVREGVFYFVGLFFLSFFFFFIYLVCFFKECFKDILLCIEKGLPPWGGELTIQRADDALQNCVPETRIILLSSITQINAIKGKFLKIN